MIFVEATLPVARKKLVTLAQSAQLFEAAKLLCHTGTDIVVACDSGGVLAGILTKTHIVEKVSCCEGLGCAVTVSSVMTRDVLVT